NKVEDDYYFDEREDRHEDSPDPLFNNNMHFGPGDADCSDQKRYDQQGSGHEVPLF
ncbi:41319_t:CDS:2, partial [Gigaspora margarita]